MKCLNYYTFFLFFFWTALLKRNLILIRRSPRQVIGPLISVLILNAIVAALVYLIQPKSKDPIDSFPQYPLSKFKPDQNLKILVAPDSNEIKAIVDASSIENEIQYVADDQQMLNEYRKNRPGYYAGIFFYLNGSLPDEMGYNLRFPHDNAPGTGRGGPDNTDKCYQDDGLGECQGNDFVLKGFLTLQAMVDEALLKVWNGNGTLALDSFNWRVPSIESWNVNMMPLNFKPANSVAVNFVIPLFLPLLMTSFVNSLLVNLCTEKEKKIKDSMRVMGMMESAFWMSWGTIYWIVALVFAVITQIFIYAGSYFQGQSAVIFIVVILYFGSMVSFSFFLSAFIKKAKTAGSLGGFVVFILTFLYLAIYIPFITGSFTSENWIHYLVGLLPPLAFAQTLAGAADYDLNTEGGIQFSNIDQYSQQFGRTWSFSVQDGMVILAVDWILFYILAVYVENIIPGTLGYHLKPFYFLDPSYWGIANGKSKISDVESTLPFTSNCEPIPREFEGKNALKIRNLTKVFQVKQKEKFCGGKVPKKAVNDLSMDIYEGQITCLLGHNGAGKTTTINIITGLMMPTSGGATYDSFNIKSIYDLNSIRAMTGVCPQHDILFDNLTCEEHLRIFGTFKGIVDLQAEVDRLLKAVLLEEQRHSQAGTMSGGQKRKLSVAIALIGNPRFVFLDEPSAGLDPYSRRALWGLLKAEKKDKVILLTTHFMDEADILSDRKGIMADGTLKCMGSSLFLKNRFGIGYHLDMNLFAPVSSSLSALEDVRKETEAIIKGKIPTASEIRFHGQELSYSLPQSEMENFSDLFNALDAYKTSVSQQSSGINSYGVSMTSLEEVFFKIGEEHAEDNGKEHAENIGKTPVATEEVKNMPITPLIDSYHALQFQRFITLLYLRMSMVAANVSSMIFIFLVPVAMTILGGYIMSLLEEEPGTAQPQYFREIQTSDLAQRAKSWDPSRQNGSRPSLPTYKIPSIYFDRNNAFDGIESLINRPPLTVDTILLDLDNTTAFKDYAGLLNDSYVFAGLQMKPGNQTVFYNVTNWKAAPVIINWFSNILLRAKHNTSSKSIEVASAPFPSDRIQSPFAFASIFFIASAVAIVIPMHAATDMVKDRYFKTRNQLRIMGVGTKMYWLAVFTWDFLCASIILITSFIVIKAFNVPIISKGSYYSVFVLLYLLYMPMLILLGYLLSFLFNNIEKCQTQLPGLLILVSFIPFQVISNLNDSDPETAELLHTVFSIILPPYNLFGGMYFLIQFHSSTSIVDIEKVQVSNILSETTVGISLVMILVWNLLALVSLPILDGWKTNGYLPFMKPKKNDKLEGSKNDGFVSNVESSPQDDDVQDEEDSVANIYKNKEQRSDATVLVKDLQKTFYKSKLCKGTVKQKRAVKKLNFAVQKGEIFGLLGPNGAGKSTTMNIITADTSLDSGEIYIGGHNIVSSQSSAFQVTGYCPQHNPLYDDLTLKRHLYLYAAVRGIKGKKNIDIICNYLMNSLKIVEHANKPSKTLSGGTKRKLCFAISLLGQPESVLMDEPSTGMDPGSKRFLWNTIISMFKGEKRGAILTTHSMEEADALCSRIGIMIQGAMKCIGSSQHIKDKHGSGYQLEVKLKASKLTSQADEDRAVKDCVAFTKTIFLNTEVELKENFGE